MYIIWICILIVTLLLIYPLPPPFLLDEHSLFCKLVSVFLCGNRFICVSYYITPISHTLGYRSFAFRLTSCLWLSPDSSVVPQRAVFHCFPWLIFHRVHGALLLYPFTCWWTFWFASLSWLLWIRLQCSFCSLCLLDSGLLRWEAEWCACWIERYLNFYFSVQLLSVLIIGCYQFTCHQQAEGTQFSKTPSAFIVWRVFTDGILSVGWW